MSSTLIIFFTSFLLVSANTSLEEWDLLIFTQSWPTTVCYTWKAHNPSHSCTMPSHRDSWTIHGIWPTKKGTIGPGFCNSTWPLNITEITPLLPQLEQYWTNIEKGTPLSALWSHEWTKHGTCAAALNPLKTQFRYFSQGLEWIEMYIMSGILSKANILPSKDAEYHPLDIYDAVKNHIQRHPFVECIYDRRTGRNYLLEIRICFDKALNLIDCDGIVGWETPTVNGEKILTNCDLTKSITYTNIVPDNRLNTSTSMLLNVYRFIRWLSWFTF